MLYTSVPILGFFLAWLRWSSPGTGASASSISIHSVKIAFFLPLSPSLSLSIAQTSCIFLSSFLSWKTSIFFFSLFLWFSFSIWNKLETHRECRQKEIVVFLVSKKSFRNLRRQHTHKKSGKDCCQRAKKRKKEGREQKKEQGLVLGLGFGVVVTAAVSLPLSALLCPVLLLFFHDCFFRGINERGVSGIQTSCYSSNWMLEVKANAVCKE